MKVLLLVLTLLAGLGFAQTRYVVIEKLENNSLTVNYYERITPTQAAGRGALGLTAQTAKAYKAVMIPTPRMATLQLSPTAQVRLLTYPNLALKTVNLATFRQFVNRDEGLAPEFEYVATQDTDYQEVFAVQVSGGSVSRLEQINLRALTGVYEQHALIKRVMPGNPTRLEVDFVEFLDTLPLLKRYGKTWDDAPGGASISNQNSRLRIFPLALGAPIRLLKNAGERFNATPAQLVAGLAGQDFGWSFDYDTPFVLKISEVSGQVLQMSQVYLP